MASCGFLLRLRTFHFPQLCRKSLSVSLWSTEAQICSSLREMCQGETGMASIALPLELCPSQLCRPVVRPFTHSTFRMPLAWACEDETHMCMHTHHTTHTHSAQQEKENKNKNEKQVLPFQEKSTLSFFREDTPDTHLHIVRICG